MRYHAVALELCRFQELLEDSCFFCAVPDQTMMVFRKCGEDVAYCVDDGATYQFHADVPVSPQQIQ